MSRGDLIHLQGKVTAVRGGGSFIVETDGGFEIIAKLGGRIRRNRIRVELGDNVTVGVSPYDPKRGMIVHRH